MVEIACWLSCLWAPAEIVTKACANVWQLKWGAWHQASNRIATRDLSRISVIIATAYLALSENMAPPHSIKVNYWPCSLFLLKFLFCEYTDPTWPHFPTNPKFHVLEHQYITLHSFPANIIRYPHDTSIVYQFYLHCTTLPWYVQYTPHISPHSTIMSLRINWPWFIK